MEEKGFQSYKNTRDGGLVQKRGGKNALRVVSVWHLGDFLACSLSGKVAEFSKEGRCEVKSWRAILMS